MTGRSTAEADATFEQARRRFEAARTHENADNPINDTAEVQRTVEARWGRSPSSCPRSTVGNGTVTRVDDIATYYDNAG